VADLRGVAEQAVLLDRGEDREGRGDRDRVPAERAAVVPLGEQGAVRAERDARADRQAPAEPLRQREDVGLRALLVLEGEPRAGAADRSEEHTSELESRE